MFIAFVLIVGGWAYGQKKLSAEQFIVKKLSERKNPFAYIPFNRDLFLPTEEEEMKEELKKSYPENGFSLGSIVFVNSNDSTYQREPMVDAYGAPLQHFTFDRGPSFSVRNDNAYFRRKQQYHLNQYPNLGRFLFLYSKRPD